MQLIVPALDEERRLPETLRALRTFVHAQRARLGEVEVIVVDNASTDRTAEIALAFSGPDLPIRVVHCARRGKGAAVAAGVAATTAEVIGFLDADGATDLDALLVGAELVAGGADLAVASRALAGSVTVERHSRVRALGATGYRAAVRRLVPGIRDTQCGFKLMRGPLARTVFAELTCAGFSFDVELIARFQARGARIVEFPVTWVDQPGSTFVPLRHGALAFGALVAIAWRLREVPRSAADPVALSRTPPASLHGVRAAVLNWRDPWHSEAGGSERYAWHFATALRDAGARVDFLTARDTGQRRADRVDGICVRRGGRQYSYYVWAWGQLALRRLTRRSYDVVIDTEAGIPTFSPLLVPRRTAVVLVVHHVHLDQFGTYLPDWLAAFARFMEGRAMPAVYQRVRTITVSESTRHEMVERLRWRAPVDIVHNGADPAPDDADARDLQRVVVLSRLAAHKRIDLVIRAIDRLRLERPGLRLEIIGKGLELPSLSALVDELGLGGVVTLHGYLEEAEKHRVLGSGALHVCASDIEGWGQVVVEAARHGVPTLARDVPGLRDSIRDGETGWLVPTGPEDGVEEILDALVHGIRMSLKELEEPGAQAEFAASCRAWADRFSWSRMHRQVLDVVVGALGSSG